VWLNPERLERELEHGQGYSLTLVHELIHSLQGDDPLKWSGTQTVAESELEDLLCEGATEGQTRMLLRGHATEFEEHIREDGMAFVLVLAEISAEGDEDQAMELVAKLAFCSNTERPQLAADLLCEGRVADLTEAAHEYATFAFDGSHPPAELMSRAGVLLRAVKAGPRLRADGAAELAFEAGLARLDASERV
jgi:hypothetical protein